MSWVRPPLPTPNSQSPRFSSVPLQIVGFALYPDRRTLMITPYANWPGWVQTLVVAPHAILGWVATWLWWPKTDQGWRKLGFVAAYLVVFALVMHYAFKAW